MTRHLFFYRQLFQNNWVAAHSKSTCKSKRAEVNTGYETLFEHSKHARLGTAAAAWGVLRHHNQPPLGATCRAGLCALRLAHAKVLGAKELHLQAFGDPSTYVKWATEIYEIAHQEEIAAVIKIPLVRPAIAQVPELKALGGKILMSAC